MTNHFSYMMYGMRVASELRLPELAATAAVDGEADVAVRFGHVPASLPNPQHVAPAYQINRDEFLLTVPAVARYLVRSGREVVIDALPGVEERDICVFLLGSAFGALCHQRGLLPLHASAVEVNGRCIAFAGPSGSGKSTLAASLGHKGYRLVSDDLCVVAIDENGRPMAQPAIPQLKLWADTLETLALKRDDLQRTRARIEKYLVPIEGGFRTTPLPLERIYRLREERGSRTSGIETFGGLEAVSMISENTFRPRFVIGMGLQAPHFARCAAVAKSAGVHRVTRPKAHQRTEEIIACLEAHWRSE